LCHKYQEEEKMKKGKRFLCLLLVVALTLSIMSTGVLAATANNAPADEATAQSLSGDLFKDLTSALESIKSKLTDSSLVKQLNDLLTSGSQKISDWQSFFGDLFKHDVNGTNALIASILKSNAANNQSMLTALANAFSELTDAQVKNLTQALSVDNINYLLDTLHKNNTAAFDKLVSLLPSTKAAEVLKDAMAGNKELLGDLIGAFNADDLTTILQNFNDDQLQALTKALGSNQSAFQTVINNLPSAKLADLLKNFNSADLPAVIENLSPANLTKALEDLTASNVAALMDVLKGNTDAMNALVKNLPSSRLAEALKTFNEDNLNALLNVLNSDNMAKVLDNLSATSLANALKTLDNGNLAKILDNMSATKLAEALKTLDNGNLAKILDNMSATKLAEALKSLAPLDLNNLVNQFSPAKLAEILKNLDTTSLVDLLKTLSTNKLNGLKALISAMDPQQLLTALETLKAENIDAFKALLNSDALTAIMKNLTSGQLVDALAAANKDNIQALMDVLTGNSVLAKNLLLALKELNAQSLENLLNLLSKSEIADLLSKLGLTGIEDLLKNLSNNDIISLLKNLFAKGFSFEEISNFLKSLINGSSDSSFISRIKAILDKLKSLLTGDTDISDDKTPLADAGMLNSTDHNAYVSGYPNGTFKPTGRLTRAEAAQMLYNLLTDTARTMYSSSSNSFSDVSADKWYNVPVSTLTSAGAINGYANGTYRPAQNITRAEFTKILVAMYGVDSTATCSYNDVSSSNWAYQYIATAAKLGWIAGYSDGSFKPGQPITRAETVTILNRVLSRSFDTSFTGSVRTFVDVQRGLWYYNDVMEAANGHTYTRTGTVETWTALK
jgi:Mg/Co/Ni transporter MgtE